MPPKSESNFARDPNELISRERVRGIIKNILMPKDLTNEGDEEIIYKQLNELIAQENINLNESSGEKKIEDLALSILSKREAIKKNLPNKSIAIEKESVVGVGETSEAALRDALKNSNKDI